MELTRFEKQRTGLVEFLIVLIMIFLGLIMVLAYGSIPGFRVPALIVLALFTCLYLLARERRLRKLEGNLVDELLAKNRKIDLMGHELEDERHKLKHERGRAVEIEALLTEISSLYRAISAVNSEENDDKVTGAVLRAALKLVGGDRGSIMLLDNRGEHLYIASALGLPEEIVSVTLQKVGEGVAGWVAESGESVLLNTDAQGDQRFVSPNALSARVQSAMCVPLKFKNAVIGVMNLSSTEETCEFTDSDMRRATFFGEHASVSIMNARLMLSLANAKDSTTLA